MKYQTYTKYKPTSLEWYKQIPIDWRVKKIKHIARTVNGGTPATSNESYWEGNIPWLPSGMIHDNIINSDSAYKFISEEALNNSATKYIKPKAVLIALTGATCANIAYLTFKATANQSVVGIEVNDSVASRFLFYLLLSQREQILINKTGGAQSGINEQNVKDIFCIFPSKDDQQKIADFLDRKTSQMDGLIKKDKRLIELLQERRIALINQAVTKGLDPNAKLVDSGVDWIGEIPEGWRMDKIKFISSSHKKKNLSDSPDLKYIGLEHVRPEEGKLIGYSSNGEVDGETIKFNRNNVLFGKLRPYLAKVVLSEFCGICSGEFIVFTESGKIDMKFLFYRLLSKSFIDYVNGITYGVKMPRADINEVTNIKIPVPSIEEQEEIVKYLDGRIESVFNKIKIVKKRIKLLEEYKKSLIYNAVTGKIKI